MTTSWELIMAARTSWHSSEAASGEKQSKEKNGASSFLSLPISKPTPHNGWSAQKSPGSLQVLEGYCKNTFNIKKLIAQFA